MNAGSRGYLLLVFPRADGAAACGVAVAANRTAARSAALALSIFGPRNAAETGRVLGPGGALIMATPGPAHLGELRRPLGLIGIDEQKLRRIAGAYRDYALSGLTNVNYQLCLDHGRGQLRASPLLTA